MMKDTFGAAAELQAGGTTYRIHRIGALRGCDQFVLAAVAARHRGEAFAACEFVMDYLKTRAPFWKKEMRADGAHWVEARASDEAGMAKWRAGARA